MSHNFTFICGDDDFLVAAEGRKLFESLTQDLMDDLSMEIVDGNAGKAEEAVQAIASFISAAQTLSLFGEKKTIWLKDIIRCLLFLKVFWGERIFYGGNIEFYY